ncbi:TolC family outer membrane protein [Neptunomonas japonica]|uniref:Outer membrane channel protein n=1 Tax=Neptunomonas japonica JAMM 1380 TaxID=1441457 RepID=A0A7R6SWJ9_9GAMM|nr:TolC family outer membrane protein [Neptunomonas japonica]BBB30511.1 outer membrane channel protein [Neptunomonas japonica JAMM 1380]
MKFVSYAIRAAMFASLCSSATLANAAALEDIYLKALSNDAQLKVAEATFRANKEALPQARAGLLPNINATANTSYTDSDLASFNNHGYTVSLVQPVFSASRWFTYQQGKTLDEQAQLRFDLAQQNLILQSVETYLNVLRAKSNLETAESQERAIKRRLDQVNAQFEVGLIAITDVHEAQASYDNARVNLIEAEGALDNSYEAIERLTGETITRTDLLSEEYPIQELAPAAPEEWLTKALSSNISLRVVKADIDVSRKSAQIAKAGHYPTLDLNATYDRDKGTANSNNWNDGHVVGLTFSVPLYQGGATSSRSRQAYAQLDAATQTFDDTARGVKQSTRSLLRNIKTNVQSVYARQQSIISSQAALDATSEGFSVGTRNVVDVLAAEQALYTAKRDYATARFDYVLNLFTFKQQVGTLNPEDLSGLDNWLIIEG